MRKSSPHTPQRSGHVKAFHKMGSEIPEGRSEAHSDNIKSYLGPARSRRVYVMAHLVTIMKFGSIIMISRPSSNQEGGAVITAVHRAPRIRRF